MFVPLVPCNVSRSIAQKTLPWKRLLCNLAVENAQEQRYRQNVVRAAFIVNRTHILQKESSVNTHVFWTYRVSDHDGWFGIVIAEVKRDFHAGITTTHDQNSLPGELLAGLVLGDVDDFTGELLQPINLRHHALRILTGRHHKPLANVLDLGARRPGCGHGLDSPELAGLVVLGRLHALVELRLDVEPARIRLEVVYELFLGGVFREFLGEWELRQLAELLGDVKPEAIVSPVLP